MFRKDAVDPHRFIACQFSEVLPGGKGLTHPGYINAPDVMHGSTFIEPGLHLQCHGPVEGIEFVRTVKDDLGHMAFDLKKYARHNACILLNVKTAHIRMVEQVLVHQVVIPVGRTDPVQVNGIVVVFDEFHAPE